MSDFKKAVNQQTHIWTGDLGLTGFRKRLVISLPPAIYYRQQE